LAVPLRDIYLYAVCFVMLILVVIGLFQLVGALLAFFDPTGGVYRFPLVDGEAEIKRRLADEHPGATEEELAALVREERERLEAEERARRNFWRLERLVNALAYIVIAFPIYRYHWRKVRAGT